jgi:hypothetical protein
MTFDRSNLNLKKKSLGALRKATKTKERSPDLTGQLKLQRHTLETFNKQFEDTDSDEIACNTAAWGNKDDRGAAYMTVELSPRFMPRSSTQPKSNLIDFIFDDREEQ